MSLPYASLSLFAFFWLVGNLHAAPKVCSQTEEGLAMAIVPTAAMDAAWPAPLYESFRQFSHCDDGAIAEGFTEATVSGLANKWDRLPEIAVLAKKDAAFSKFILKHIDESGSAEELKIVATKAKASCPKGHEAFCKQLEKKATAAAKAAK